eukprot:comp13597_c0_seq1/m.9198 comp13597_c0_seq1/g.9198  ORF comp13597_c0_seq1/g.9198 comp13597_c0_seq1/m.9198 type:complete len:186 (-) comp13597_c0_seq1:141-698(-)
MGSVFSTLFDKIWGRANTRLLMVGLDFAGKTTILYRVKLNHTVSTIATVGFNAETIKRKNSTFTVWDVGGSTGLRPLWRHYFPGTCGIIFVVDSTDHPRFAEAQHELKILMEAPELESAVLLVFANKNDLPGAADTETVTSALNLQSLNRKWKVQPSNALTGDGLYEGLDWLVNALDSKQQVQVE